MTNRGIASLATGSCLVLAMTAGCATTQTTDELKSARALMEQARAGETAQRNPAGLRVAERALASAEAAHEDDPGSDVERDRAYIAERRVRIAMASARRSAQQDAMAREDATYRQQLEVAARARAATLEETQDELRSVRSQLSQGGEQLNAATQALRQREQELVQREQELAAERAARAAAEQQLAAMMGELQQFADVRQQQEDLIITLSGAVLFGTGQTRLLPDAQRRLRAIATVIRSNPNRHVLVVGHTDSQGPDETNLRLSQDRAQSVRDQLVTEGVPASQVEAVGRGESEPVADNNTTDGRANNRRVEIILRRQENTSGGASTQQPHQGMNQGAMPQQGMNQGAMPQQRGPMPGTMNNNTQNAPTGGTGVQNPQQNQGSTGSPGMPSTFAPPPSSSTPTTR